MSVNRNRVESQTHNKERAANMNLLEKAKQLDGQTFNDGKRFSAMKADGSIVRCATQDGAETVAMQGSDGAVFRHRDNFVEVVSSGKTIGLVWPQS